MASIVVAGDTSGTVTLAAPAVAGTTTLTLPTANGTVLTTASTGISASNITTGTLPKAQLPTGSVLQVVQTVKTDTFSTTSGSLTDITGMSVSITPSSSSNKILIFYSLGQIIANNSAVAGIALLRGVTVIGAGATAGSRILVSTGQIDDADRGQPHSYVFLDSPATTSSTTYKLQIYVNGGNTLYVNRSSTDTDGTTYNRAASTITVMEIAA